MKYIKILIIVFVILVITLTLILLQQLKKKNEIQRTNMKEASAQNEVLSYNRVNNIQNNVIGENTSLSEEILNTDIIDTPANTTLKNVENAADFFTVQSIFNGYIDKLVYKDIDSLYDILSVNYLNQYQITKYNLINTLQEQLLHENEQYYVFNINEMLVAQLENETELYIVKGNCRLIDENKKISVTAMIERNNSNNLYSIYPYQYMLQHGYEKYKVSDKINSNEANSITDREANHYRIVQKNDQQVIGEYFEHFKELINYYPDIAYNQLNSEYKNQRFTNKEEFNEYRKANANILSTMNLTKYKIDSNNNYTDYICIDQYGNTYTLRQQGGIMKYTIFLDDYTVPSKEFTETYNGYNDMTKAKYQAEALIKKINAKNYKNIYEHLNSTFKENNFKTLEEFKTYVKNNFYEENSFSIEDREVTNNYYIFECRIANAQNAKEIKKINIIVSIVENTDYTMSFSFSE